MFQILNLSTGETLYFDEPRYVKLDERGFWSRCDESDAQCISFCGNRFSIANREVVDDAPQIVAIKKVDAAQKISQINLDGLKNAQNIEEVKAAVEDIIDAVLDIYLTFPTPDGG